MYIKHISNTSHLLTFEIPKLGRLSVPKLYLEFSRQNYDGKYHPVHECQVWCNWDALSWLCISWTLNCVCAASPACCGQASVTAYTQDGMPCQVTLDFMCQWYKADQVCTADVSGFSLCLTTPEKHSKNSIAEKCYKNAVGGKYACIPCEIRAFLEPQRYFKWTRVNTIEKKENIFCKRSVLHPSTRQQLGMTKEYFIYSMPTQDSSLKKRLQWGIWCFCWKPFSCFYWNTLSLFSLQ